MTTNPGPKATTESTQLRPCASSLFARIEPKRRLPPSTDPDLELDGGPGKPPAARTNRWIDSGLAWLLFLLLLETVAHGCMSISRLIRGFIHRSPRTEEAA